MIIKSPQVECPKLLLNINSSWLWFSFQAHCNTYLDLLILLTLNICLKLMKKTFDLILLPGVFVCIEIAAEDGIVPCLFLSLLLETFMLYCLNICSVNNRKSKISCVDYAFKFVLKILTFLNLSDKKVRDQCTKNS